MTSLTSSRGPFARFGNRIPVAASAKAALTRALQDASYEVLPFKSTEGLVTANVPLDVPLTVTTTEARGLEPTLDLAERLTRHGYTVAPHLAARQVRDRDHLADILARLDEAGIDSVFAIAGDAAEPAGPFPDALSLLEAFAEVGHTFASVGIGGYPEGHGRIATELVGQALAAKAPLATHVITQMCFDAATTLRWARTVRTEGIGLPIRVGIPGAVNRQKLVRVSAGLGLGQSARFLAKQRGMIWRFLLPGGYSPDRLIHRLAPSFGQSDNNLAGFHIFTFNELARTQAWRMEWLERLA